MSVECRELYSDKIERKNLKLNLEKLKDNLLLLVID